MNKKYTLTFNKKQLNIMQEALHSFARMQVGQLMTAMESITFYSDIKDKLNQVQKDWLGQLTLYDHNEMHGHTDDGNVAWDIYKVLRHQAWKDAGSTPKNVVSSDLVHSTSKEALPEISSEIYTLKDQIKEKE